MFAFSIGTPQLIALIIFLIGGLGTLFWFMVRLIVKQFNESLSKRFETLEKARAEESAKREAENTKTTERFKELEKAQHSAENELHKLKLEIAKDYWRREDAIRNEAVTQAKLDGLARRLDEFLNRKP